MLPLPEFLCVAPDGRWLSVRILGQDYGVIVEPGQKTAKEWRAAYHTEGQLPFPPEVSVMTILPPGAEEQAVARGQAVTGSILGEPIVPRKSSGPPLLFRDGKLIGRDEALERDAWEAKR